MGRFSCVLDYLPNGLVSRIRTNQNGALVFNEEYQYDANGNKTYADENGKITKYSYDGLNRISSVTENGYDITQYEYDGYNNISKEYIFNNTGISAKKYFYDANNRLILSETDDNYITYDYDNAGNLTKKTDNGRIEYYTYDGYNRLNSYYDGHTQAEYAYNLSGLRKSKTVNGKKTRFVYSGADIVGEITNDNYYIYYRGTELLGSKSYSGDINFYRIDGHGSVTAVLSPNGEELKNYNYDAFGAKKAFVIPPMGENTILFQWKAETDGIHNPFGYCGEYVDSETGLTYLRNRYYDNTIGRFTTEDTHWNINNMIYGDKEYEEGETKVPDVNAIMQNGNLYVYCVNNPTNFEDSSGLSGQRLLQKLFTYALMYVHYNRNSYNVDLPKSIDEAKENEWRSDVPADCHQFTVIEGNGSNVKYVSPDGKREVIFDSQGAVVMKDEDIGTYNFIPSGSTWDNIGHFIVDIVPWLYWGNSPQDSTITPIRIYALIGGKK